MITLAESCWAEPPQCYPDVSPDDKGIIWKALTPVGLTHEAEQNYWSHPCPRGDTVCLSATDLACAFDAMMGRDIPNTMGRGGPASYYSDLPGYVAVIRSIGRKHPERVKIYCDLLTKIAGMDEENPDTTKTLVSAWTIELAARLYALGHKNCAKQVMAAFPHNPAMTAIIATAREDCGLNPYPGCAAIRR